MKRGGRARRQVIQALCPTDGLIIDVGADHGHVAHALGAIATERQPKRAGRSDVPWVIADGLRPFRSVYCAITAGMGAETITRILDAGPRPQIAIVHAQDDPPKLRRFLADRGWRIDAEALAPEAGRFAEVMRIVNGEETATGLTLAFGPTLLAGSDPLLVPHLRQLIGHHQGIAAHTKGTAPDVHSSATERIAFLREQLAKHGS